MVIIVREDEAVMFYTDSQWSDAQDMMHGSGIGYTVANTVINSHNILGISSSIDAVTGITSTDGVNALTHNQVAALAIGSSFTIPA
jgi:hypothetical protein